MFDLITISFRAVSKNSDFQFAAAFYILCYARGSLLQQAPLVRPLIIPVIFIWVATGYGL